MNGRWQDGMDVDQSQEDARQVDESEGANRGGPLVWDCLPRHGGAIPYICCVLCFGLFHCVLISLYSCESLTSDTSGCTNVGLALMQRSHMLIHICIDSKLNYISSTSSSISMAIPNS